MENHFHFVIRHVSIVYWSSARLQSWFEFVTISHNDFTLRAVLMDMGWRAHAKNNFILDWGVGMLVENFEFYPWWPIQPWFELYIASLKDTTKNEIPAVCSRKGSRASRIQIEPKNGQYFFDCIRKYILTAFCHNPLSGTGILDLFP